MCGIAGYVGTRSIEQPLVDECLRRMRHRGPDASGVYRSELQGGATGEGRNEASFSSGGRHVLLLHTRLSIIDLDPRANQPFRLGPAVLICNGELYNYRELRSELARHGDEFRTDSDTEVLARVLVTRGWRGLDDCEGMWAFAMFDERDGSLLLGRDRFGEKPLYIFEAADGLYFGSEIKFIVALLGRPMDVNVDHLQRYLVNGYKALYKGGEGFFYGVRDLDAGAILRIDVAGAKTTARYWLPAFEQDEAMSFPDAVAQVREALVRSVELRLRADVPLAFCMSGGVDSNALIAIARKVLDHDVHGFTIVNDDRRYDERELVSHSVQELGIRHTPIPVDHGRFLDNLRGLVRGHDAPVYTITYYAQWMLMRSISEHGYRISISGTGADELFSGYYDHHNAYLYELHAAASLNGHRDAPRLDPDFVRSLAAWETHIKPIVRNPFLSDPDVFITGPEFRDHIYLDAAVFSSFLHAPWSERFREERYCPGLLRNRMLNEMFHEAVPPILHEDDLNAMSQSIENRSPFLDRPLFELCQRIPTRHLVRDGFAKAVLREAMRGIAPQRVLNERRKVGFNAPIESFLDATSPSVREAILDRSPVFDYVRRKNIEELISQSGLSNSRSKFVFYFLNAKMFLEEFSS